MQFALSDLLQSATGNIQVITNVEGLLIFGNFPGFGSGSSFFCNDLQPIGDNVRSNFAVAIFCQCSLVKEYASPHMFEINPSFINDPPFS